MRQSSALVSILRECGLRGKTAGRLERIIDQDDYLGLTSDDIAGALLRWRAVAVDRAHEQGVRFATPPWCDPQQVLMNFAHQE